MKVYVGTSGWVYKDWAKRFYPPNLKNNEDKLRYYAKHFKTVEINNSFYRLPSETAFKHWRQTVDEDFIFTVKLSRFLTHVKRLKADERTGDGVDRYAGRAKYLGDKLGVTLVQLPANYKINLERIDNLAQHFSAAEKKYSGRFRLAVEFRHESWFTEKTYSMLKKYNIASVINSAPPGWSTNRKITADFAYLRFHGSKKLYSSSYNNRELDEWAEFIMSEAGNCKEVFCYFNNDKSAKAVENAAYLLRRLS